MCELVSTNVVASFALVTFVRPSIFGDKTFPQTFLRGASKSPGARVCSGWADGGQRATGERRRGVVLGSGRGADAVVGDEGLQVGKTCRDAGGGDGLGTVDFGGDFEVEGEELGEKVGFGIEAVGGQHSGVEGGVGVLEGVGAGEFEGAVEGAETAFEFLECFGADAADFAAGLGDGVHVETVAGLCPS